jgi:23S rRNA (adenine-N6)-dimethyltransferase
VAVRRARSAPPSRRRHAQHFLSSTRLAADIVRAAAISRDDLVLDIGAGRGALTAEPSRRSGRVRAIEIDEALVAQLRRRFGRAPNVEVVHADALRLALPGEPFRVVANIPFNACTANLRHLLDGPGTALEQADLIVELEVAWKRARVSPSTALGVYWGAWYEFAIVRRLDASVFAPPPRTDAALLRIVRRTEPLVSPRDAEAYRALVRAGFQRRGPIRRSLRGSASPLELKRLGRDLGFASDAPPWELDQHQWAGIFRFVRRGSLDLVRHEPL